MRAALSPQLSARIGVEPCICINIQTQAPGLAGSSSCTAHIHKNITQMWRCITFSHPCMLRDGGELEVTCNGDPCLECGIICGLPGTNDSLDTSLRGQSPWEMRPIPTVNH